MAPKKSESSAAAGPGINAVRKGAAHDGIVPSRPESASSGRPQPRADGSGSLMHVTVRCNLMV